MTPPRRFITALALAGTAACPLLVADATFLAPPVRAATSMPQRASAPAVPASRAVGSVVRPGAFCKKAEAGRTARAADGREMRCSTSATDSRYRWRAVK